MMLILDPEGLILDANVAFEKHLQRPRSEFVQKPVFELLNGTALERLQYRLREKQIGASDSFPLDFLVNGVFRITRAMMEFDPTSNRYAVVCTPFITMPEDESFRWRLALESTNAGFWGWDMTSDVIYFSEQLETMFGYEVGEWPLSFHHFRTLVHPDDKAANERVVTPFLKGEATTFELECRLRRKDGTYIWMKANGLRAIDPSGNQVANGWFFDIDEQRRSQEELIRSEEKSQLLLQTIPDLLFVFDRDGKYIEAKTSDPSRLISPIDEIVGRYVHDYFDAKFVDLWLGYLRQVVDTKKPIVAEYDINVPAGHFYFEARLFPRPDGTVLAIIRDVTERVTAQSERQKSDQRLRAFIDNCPATVFNQLVDPKTGAGTYTFVAGRIEEIFEATAEEIVGTPVDSTSPPYIHPDDLPAALILLGDSVANATPYNWLGRFVLKSGKVKWINTIATPTLQPDGQLLYSAIALDVTHERELARQVQEQQAMMSSSSRLAALGEMAGGIAHEINNPLTVAHAHASRLRDAATEGRTLDRDQIILSTQKIESVCMRISRIIQGLRSIARDGDNDRFTISPLRPIIEDALSLSTEKFRHKNIELRVEGVTDSMTVEVRSVQISQVLVNLLLNAQHAVEELESGRWIHVAVFEGQSTIEIRVSDSGLGILPENRDRIFDPFFTTKEVGKGTGLGLSVSAAIAESHGGALYFDDKAAVTTFVLVLQKRQMRPVVELRS